MPCFAALTGGELRGAVIGSCGNVSPCRGGQQPEQQLPSPRQLPQEMPPSRLPVSLRHLV